MAANNNAAINTPNVQNLSLRSILDKNRLNHNNFTDWFRNLRIVLKHENKSYVLDDPVPDKPDVDDALAYAKWLTYTKDSVQVSCLMLACMTPEFQKDFENHGAYDMITQLKERFLQQRVEGFETVRALHACRMDEDSKKGQYPDPKARFAKGDGYIQRKGKGKAKANPPKSKDKKLMVTSNGPCYECGEVGHLKRNCPKYLKELKKKRDAEQPSGTIFMIHVELNAISSNTWVLDTGCGTHICNMLQGFKRNRHLKTGDISLFMGNGAKVQVEAQGDYVMKLPIGLEMSLENVLYAPSLTRNIISVSRLKHCNFDLKFVNDEIHVSMNDVFYFKAMPLNGIYELVHDTTSFDSSMYQASTKKLKVDLSDTYLWHCRLGHINKNRILSLQ